MSALARPLPVRSGHRRQNPLDFEGQPFWLCQVTILAIFVFLPAMTLFSIVVEDKAAQRTQSRAGPTSEVGP